MCLAAYMFRLRLERALRPSVVSPREHPHGAAVQPEKLSVTGIDCPSRGRCAGFRNRRLWGICCLRNWRTGVCVGKRPLQRDVNSGLDRSGKRLAAKGEAGSTQRCRCPRTGERAALSVGGEEDTRTSGSRILDGGTERKVTLPETGESGLVRRWKSISSTSGIGMQPVVYRKPSNGGRRAEMFSRWSPTPDLPTPLRTANGLFTPRTEIKPEGRPGFFPLRESRGGPCLFDSPFDEIHAQFSPDGKWMAYTSNESVQKSGICAIHPCHRGQTGRFRYQWRQASPLAHDGKELFYISTESKPNSGSRQTDSVRVSVRRSEANLR